MFHRSIIGLLSSVASVAFAGQDPDRSIAAAPGKDGRAVASRRPVATVSTSQPASVLPDESPGIPLNRNPIPAYQAVPPGPSQTVSGVCFVVTDAGRRINLSQVQVNIYSQREFGWYAQEVHVRARARFEGMKSRACPENFAALSIPEMDRSLAAARILQHDLHVVWQVLPAADASTRTDADGRFSITHQVAPPYIVFAVGSRTVGDEIEYYRWQVPSSVIANPLRVELSNDNLQ